MKLNRKILIGFIASVLILAGATIFSIKNNTKTNASKALVDHTNQVLHEFSEILVGSIDAETGVRGFIITGNESFLDSFLNADRKVFGHLEKVKVLTKDNSNQQKNIEKLEYLIILRFNHLKESVALRKKDFESARNFIALAKGKELQDSIREIINDAQKAEYKLLAERKNDGENFNLIFSILLLIVIIVLIYVYTIVTSNLKKNSSIETENASKNWLLIGNTKLNENLIGDKSIEELANDTISFLCTYLKANIGALYIYNENENALVLSGRYAFLSSKETKEKYMMNEGLIGQAAHEKKQISITDIKDDQLRIASSILNAKPKNLLITPFSFEKKTVGVIEIGRLTDFTETEKAFINASLNDIAITVNMNLTKQNLKQVFELVKEKEQELNNQITAINKSNATIEFDLNGNILKANDNFLNLLGYTENEIVGKHHSVFVDKAYAQTEEYRKFWNNLKKGEYQQGEFERITKNKELVWIKGNYNPIHDAKGNPYKILKIATDVTLSKKQARELAIQTDELQIQQEELKQMNEELEEQAQNLKQQQEELQVTNEELEEQTQSLELKNKEVEASKSDIEQKTKQLEISSKYKSEFLANMSHELRTPLNSLLILSKDLSENKKKNLDSVQVESAEIIYKSGHDLLVLINEVLDLSKIEAGKMSINVEKVSLKSIAHELVREFKHHADQKGIKLNAELTNELPEYIRTDSQRLNQVLKNLLSNAIKFTEKGSVRISIGRKTENTIIISVADSGIGIAEDKLVAIFEAFQQAEGGTSRKYGGTGLGLSISRELAKLLGGELNVSSTINGGSVFSLIIPIEIEEVLEKPVMGNRIDSYGRNESVMLKPRSADYANYRNYPHIEDDRNEIAANDKTVLIIEDDLKFASILLKQANNKGFKCISAATGEDGLSLAAKYLPQAIILDMGLPGMDGQEVLHELKANPSVRHIPVHIISGNERSLEHFKEGAVEYLIKPVAKEDLEEAFNRIENFVNRKIKNLLIIEDSENSRKAIRILIGNGDVKCFEAGTGKDALDMFKQNQIDCIILDLGLPDMSGFDLIRKLENVNGHDIPPIIVYTGKELTKEENYELQKYAESIIIKGVKSEERLLDETALFLHRTVTNLPKSKQAVINNLYDKEAVFQSKKILLVDDDMRNLFALSKILTDRGMEIIKAENGIKALEMLEFHKSIDMVLMDIMMPEMDGYEAMKGIRDQKKHKNLPVIALTAKAMKDDKQKCIDAGANDYITKPLDTERLLSLMRVWLSK